MSRAREFADLAGSADAGGLTGRNLIINGAMQVWQRQTAATAAANTYNTVDRFRINNSTDGAYTSEQSTDTPSGTGYSLKLQVTTADTSMSAAQNAYLFHAIEAQNLQHLNYGTSDAKTVTLSFWVKSSKTGTYAVAVLKQDNTGCMFTHEYTVSSANTWEKKTITITPTAGGTSLITSAGGAIDNDNGTGLRLVWGLAWGSNFTNGTNNSWASTTSANYSTTNAVNWMDSTSNNFYLADVQLELGDTATPFEHRSYGDELARCQRYYQNYVDNKLYFNGTNEPSSEVGNSRILPTQMRADPTVGNKTTSSGSVGTYAVNAQFIRYLNTGSHSSGGINIGFDLDAEL